MSERECTRTPPCFSVTTSYHALAGARHLVTETGEPMGDEPNPSLANMNRCGFVTVASRLNFVGPA